MTMTTKIFHVRREVKGFVDEINRWGYDEIELENICEDIEGYVKYADRRDLIQLLIGMKKTTDLDLQCIAKMLFAAMKGKDVMLTMLEFAEAHA